MRVDDYDIVQVICDTASREYRISPNHDMRMQIRNFVMHVYIRQTWWDYLVIGTDNTGKNIYLAFSRDLYAYVGHMDWTGLTRTYVKHKYETR